MSTRSVYIAILQKDWSPSSFYKLWRSIPCFQRESNRREHRFPERKCCMIDMWPIRGILSPKLIGIVQNYISLTLLKHIMSESTGAARSATVTPWIIIQSPYWIPNRSIRKFTSWVYINLTCATAAFIILAPSTCIFRLCSLAILRTSLQRHHQMIRKNL